MNKLFRNLFIIILIIMFIVAFSSSYLSLSMDNLAYVLAIGIDKASDNNSDLQVSFQFSTTSKASESGSTEKAPTIMNSVTASSLSTAINLMNSYMGKELNMSHCKVIIFSEQLAEEGISDEIYTLINNTQVRPSSNIIISKCSAKTYIEQTSPELENLISKYYEIFNNSGKYTGFMPDATIGNFFNNIICTTCEPVAILGGLAKEQPSNNTTQENLNIKANESSIEGKNGSENIGMAVFKGDELVGELSSLETIAYLTMHNKVDRFLISIPDPEVAGHYLDIYLTPASSTKVKVDTSTSSPYVKIKTKFTGRIYSMSENSNYLKSEILDAISNTCNQYLESVFSAYLYKTSKEFKSDINGFGKVAQSNFFTTQEYNAYNWHDSFKNSFFDVKVDTSVKSGMLITQTEDS